MMPKRSSDKVERAVLVTGASTGIGEACAAKLSQSGFHVFAGVRKESDGEALKGKLDALTPVMIDVTDGAQVLRAAEEISKKITTGGLVGIVNNAGIVVAGPLEFLPLEDLRRQFEVNVFGQIAVTQAFLPMLRESRGRIINMSSVSGRMSAPFMGPYSASKFALESLSDALRMELKKWAIKVVLIEPGAIDTPIWDKSVRNAESIESELSADAREYYGAQYAKLRQHAKRVPGMSIPAERVAKVVHHALTASRPKTRYLVGTDAKVQARIATKLPDTWRDTVILKVLGM